MRQRCRSTFSGPGNQHISDSKHPRQSRAETARLTESGIILEVTALLHPRPVIALKRQRQLYRFTDPPVTFASYLCQSHSPVTSVISLPRGHANNPTQLFISPHHLTTMAGSKMSSACVAFVRRILPNRSKSEGESSRSSTISSRSSSNNRSSGSDCEGRSYRTSKRRSYIVYEVSESDFEEMQVASGGEDATLVVPAPCLLPGGSMSVARGPACASADRVREWQLRELEMWPQGLQPRNRLQPYQKKVSVVPGKPWGLAAVQEEEEPEKEMKAVVPRD